MQSQDLTDTEQGEPAVAAEQKQEQQGAQEYGSYGNDCNGLLKANYMANIWKGTDQE